jgi:hypothetical protein
MGPAITPPSWSETLWSDMSRCISVSTLSSGVDGLVLGCGVHSGTDLSVCVWKRCWKGKQNGSFQRGDVRPGSRSPGSKGAPAP